jgi:hypothetical protein
MGVGSETREAQTIRSLAQLDIRHERVDSGIEQARSGAGAAGGKGFEAKVGQLVDQVEQEQGLSSTTRIFDTSGISGSPITQHTREKTGHGAFRCMSSPHGCQHG